MSSRNFVTLVGARLFRVVVPGGVDVSLPIGVVDAVDDEEEEESVFLRLRCFDSEVFATEPDVLCRLIPSLLLRESLAPVPLASSALFADNNAD